MGNKLSELKATALAATPGPWEWFTSNSMARLSSTPSGKDGDVLSAFHASDGVPCVNVSQRDMAFIAAANPAAVLALLAELEEKSQELAEAEAKGVEKLAEAFKSWADESGDDYEADRHWYAASKEAMSFADDLRNRGFTAEGGEQ
ncbi:ead/Ea22-like family protein [Serratia plymuthica]|uniref:ead/Ea22-like family protein n=1 Tax=Serratia plymuthica TaxID=82996 RepID=UPI0007E9B8A3|nr:ead/Ea22-like family protein [Serratia plymuthica]